MAGGYEGAIRRIDTTAWRDARLQPQCAADTREQSAADILGCALAVVAIHFLPQRRKENKKTNAKTGRTAKMPNGETSI